MTALAHDESSQMWTLALQILVVHTIVTDLRIGHGDNLPPITWVSQDFLITGHRSVEHHFTIHFTFRTESAAGEYGSVL